MPHIDPNTKLWFDVVCDVITSLGAAAAAWYFLRSIFRKSAIAMEDLQAKLEEISKKLDP